MTLQKRVDERLDAAVFENEYIDLMGRTPMEVAIDMCTYDSTLEDEDVHDVAACVKNYQEWYVTREKNS